MGVVWGPDDQRHQEPDGQVDDICGEMVQEERVKDHLQGMLSTDITKYKVPIKCTLCLDHISGKFMMMPRGRSSRHSVTS